MKKQLASLLAYCMIAFIAIGSCVVFAETGNAVYYSDKFQGKKTANNEIFDQKELTAAHKKFAYGTMIKVTNLENNQSVVVKINDRMARHNRNIIDVSKRAAEELGFVKKGRTRVSLELVR
ncbi:MAG: septal ring lytic transglycosylase RlpA family protein [Nitrosomonas sp.]